MSAALALASPHRIRRNRCHLRRRASGATVYAYVDGNPISSVDPFGLYTFQIGFAVSLSFKIPFTKMGLAGTFGGGAAFDSTGQIAAYTFGGSGPSAGKGIVIGEQFAGSNAPTVQDLNGLFKTMGGGGGAEAAGAIDYFEGHTLDGCKKVYGGGLTAGLGAGEFVMAAPTWTTVYNSGRLW